MRGKTFLLLVLVNIVALALISGCGKPPVVKCPSVEDNPQHHYLSGMEALEKGKLDEASAKFERAVYCDEKFSIGYAGLAIVTAEKAKAQTDPAYLTVEADRAFANLKKAEELLNTDNDRFDYNVAVIRVNTALKAGEWLNEANDASKAVADLKVEEKLLHYYQGKEAANYFMGIAYLAALEFQKARDEFAAVLDAKREGKWHEKADKAWKRVDKIVRAMAGITVGDVAKKIAIKESVTRGDLVALLIDEMKLDKLFAGRIPVESQLAKMQAEFTPADVLNHEFKEEVLTVMKWKVRGLEPKYDETTKAYLFKPSEPVKRAEMALILEDVLMKLTADEKIATAYFGQEKSPFPDVRPTSPFYNAVMNMTTRGIMEAELSGEFRVDANVDGAEALLAIRVLKQRINIY